MKKQIHPIFWLFAAAGSTLLIFQNCSNGFKAQEKEVRRDIFGRILEDDDLYLSAQNPSRFVPDGANLVFTDEFQGSGSLDTSSSSMKWHYETMAEDELNNAGNRGQDANGILNPNSFVKGKRWSAWYNGSQSQVLGRDNGYLVLGGVASNQQDPTRTAYEQSGRQVRFNQQKLFTAWVDTGPRVYSAPLNKYVVNRAVPSFRWKYGYFEFKVNFERIHTPGFRVSIWLMPSSTQSDGTGSALENAYNQNPDDGAEIDVFEYEYTEKVDGHPVIAAIHSGGSEAAYHKIAYMDDLNIHIRGGDHIFGLLWEQDRIVWYVDGIEFARTTDSSKIPDVYSHLILSREMNSGVGGKLDQGGVPENGVKRPADLGLWGENVGLFTDRINSDEALIDYVRVYQLSL